MNKLSKLAVAIAFSALSASAFALGGGGSSSGGSSGGGHYNPPHHDNGPSCRRYEEVCVQKPGTNGDEKSDFRCHNECVDYGYGGGGYGGGHTPRCARYEEVCVQKPGTNGDGPSDFRCHNRCVDWF